MSLMHDILKTILKSNVFLESYEKCLRSVKCYSYTIGYIRVKSSQDDKHF